MEIQVVGDLLLMVRVWAWVRAGLAVRDATLALAEPGRRIEAGGGYLAGSLHPAARTAQDVPLIGDELSRPFAAAGEAVGGVADAGRRRVEVVTRSRRRSARATATRRLLRGGADLRLFALRAMLELAAAGVRPRQPLTSRPNTSSSTLR